MDIEGSEELCLRRKEREVISYLGLLWPLEFEQ